LNIYNHKLIYVIAALKKGISQNKIMMFKDPNVKNKYYGHYYCKLN